MNKPDRSAVWVDKPPRYEAQFQRKSYKQDRKVQEKEMIRNINDTQFRKLLGTALLGVGTVISFSSMASAAPRNNDVREARKDVKEARKDVKKEKKDLRKADSPAERRDAREDVRDTRQDLREERQDLRQERREDQRDHRPNYHRPNTGNGGWNNNRPVYNRPTYNRPAYNNRPTYNNRPAYNNRPIYNNRPSYNNGPWRGGSNYQTFTGTVMNVKSNGEFDLRVDGNTYNVYASNWPRGFNRNDVVRVYGVRSGNNDIRNANVVIVNNR